MLVALVSSSPSVYRILCYLKRRPTPSLCFLLFPSLREPWESALKSELTLGSRTFAAESRLMMLPTLFACPPVWEQMFLFLYASAALWTSSMNASRKIDFLKVDFPFVCLYVLCNTIMCVSHAFKKESFNVTSSFLLRQVGRTRVFNKFSSVFRFFMYTKILSLCSFVPSHNHPEK